MTIEIESEDPEGEGAVTIRTKRRRPPKSREEESPALVENDEPIPLFPHLDKNIENVVSVVRVYKRDPPGEGYKGDVHPTASLDFIAKRWGNGIFDFHALNASHQVLRRNENVVIASQPKADPRGSEASSLAERLLERQTSTYERDQARQQELAKEAITSARSQAQTYAEMVRADTQARMERDREFFTQQQNQTREAFQQMITQMQHMHQMNMEAQRVGHQQQMQLLTAVQEREAAQNNPLLLISVLEKGMRLGMESLAGEQDPLTTALQTGLGGMRELTKMMALNKRGESPKLASKNPPGSPPGSPKPAAKQAGISREELKEVLALKQMAESKGYDFEGIVSQAKVMIAAAPDNDDESDDDNDSDDSDQPGKAGLDN